MIQEDKDLLIKDISARLPYGVKAEYKNEIFGIEYVSPKYEEVKLDTHETWTVDVSEVKPYLFPIFTMSKEKEKEYANILVLCGTIGYSLVMGSTVEDWFNYNHFDYRGLISRGLAIDATGLNIY